MTQGALPNHKNPWFEPPDHGIGRSRGGLTTKLHLVCDGRGRPLGMVITGGNVNDTTMMPAVLEDIRDIWGAEAPVSTKTEHSGSVGIRMDPFADMSDDDLDRFIQEND